MAISNYSHFLNGVTIRGVPILQLFSGKVFWVNNSSVIPPYGITGTDASPGTYLKPFATIGYALTQVTANRGDIICVMPGHSETVSSATSIVPVAGTAVVGLGYAGMRPLLTFSATTSQIAVAAANFCMYNIRTKVSIDAVAAMFNVTASGFLMDKVDFEQTASKSPITFLKTSSAGTDLYIGNCRHVQNAAVSVTKWIDLIGADRFFIEDNFISMAATTHVIGGTTTASLDGLLKGNLLINVTASAACIVMLSGTTGIAKGNHASGGKTVLAGNIALASMQGSGDNFSSHTANKNGILDPVADA